MIYYVFPIVTPFYMIIPIGIGKSRNVKKSDRRDWKIPRTHTCARAHILFLTTRGGHTHKRAMSAVGLPPAPGSGGSGSGGSESGGGSVRWMVSTTERCKTFVSSSILCGVLWCCDPSAFGKATDDLVCGQFLLIPWIIPYLIGYWPDNRWEISRINTYRGCQCADSRRIDRYCRQQ